MKVNNSKPANQEVCDEEMVTESVDNNDPVQEMQSLNTQIDQLNTVLDILEKKNDDIQAQLVELLKSSREIRAMEISTQEKSSAS